MNPIYYAHCMAIYDSTQEQRDINMLDGLGFDVENPNTPEIDRRCRAVREAFEDGTINILHPPPFPGLVYTDAGAAVMHVVFKPMVLACRALAFRALPDGSIPAGVAQEILWAQEANIPVIELPSGLTRRFLSVDQTREYLREAGNR